jgi:hypothetical protein
MENRENSPQPVKPNPALSLNAPPIYSKKLHRLNGKAGHPPDSGGIFLVL